MTLEELQRRRSVRSYTDQPLSEKEINGLRAAISEVNSYLPGTRFQLVTDNDAPFKGKFGSYGVFKGVRNYIVAVIDTGIRGHDQIAGYAGQKIVMKATSIGLGTCFIGGTFSAANISVQMRAGEEIRFIIAVGHASEKERTMSKLLASIVHRKKMNGADFFDSQRSSISLDDARKSYPKIDKALEAVACAPSALNARPARIWIDKDNRIMSGTIKDGEFTQIDLGIAQYNFEQIIEGEFIHANPAPFEVFTKD